MSATSREKKKRDYRTRKGKSTNVYPREKKKKGTLPAGEEGERGDRKNKLKRGEKNWLCGRKKGEKRYQGGKGYNT